MSATLREGPRGRDFCSLWGREALASGRLLSPHRGRGPRVAASSAGQGPGALPSKGVCPFTSLPRLRVRPQNPGNSQSLDTEGVVNKKACADFTFPSWNAEASCGLVPAQGLSGLFPAVTSAVKTLDELGAGC